MLTFIDRQRKISNFLIEIRIPVVLCISLLCIEVRDACAVLIRLREAKCGVTGSVVTLGDVAEVFDTDPQRVSAYQQIVLAPAPAPGRPMLMDHASIQSRLRATGVNLAEIEFSGSSKVWVDVPLATSPEKPPVNIPQTQQQRIRQMVELAVGESLMKRYPQAGRFQASAQLTEQQSAQLMNIAAGGLQVAGGEPPFQREQIYLLQYKTSQGEVLTMQVPCQMQILPQVLAVLHAVSRGDILNTGDLGWRNPTDAELKKLPLTRPEEVLGREVTRNLNAGEAVSSENVRLVPLVNPGDIITVYSRSGGVRVRMDVRSQGTAGLGEMVTVQGLDGRSKLQARVTGYHEAEITKEGSTGRDIARVGQVNNTASQGAFGNGLSGTGGYAR